MQTHRGRKRETESKREKGRETHTHIYAHTLQEAGVGGRAPAQGGVKCD